jgi:serine/threonine protein kinase
MYELQQKQMTLPGGVTVRDAFGNRYVIESLLGQGQAGVVYLVTDRRVKQNLFALKEVINPDKHERERFIFEGELLKRLAHRALPRVYRVFERDKLKRVYMLMDYIKGRNLEGLLAEQPDQRFSLSLALTIMAPIVDALIYLHHQDPPVVHRDVKPANIIVPVGANEAILVDFGSAKEYVADDITTALRHRSPGYAALEQYGSGTTPRTDIYGLGATFYTLLTGIIPVDAVTRVTRIKSKGTDPLKPAHLLVPTVPATVSGAIQRAMSLSSNDRFETVEEFWQVLQAHITQQPVQIPRVTKADTPLPLAPSEQDSEHKAATFLSHLRDVPRPGTPVALLLVLLALVLTVTIAMGLLPYIWGLIFLILLCIGVLLQLFFPLLRRR